MNEVPVGSALAGHVMPTRREWLWILISALAAVLLCVLFAERRGFWVDEYITLRVSRLSWSELANERIRNGHSPLYFFYAKLFFLLGESDRIMRLSSAVMAGLATIGVALLALELGLRRYLGALLALAPFTPYWMTAGTLYRYMMPLIALGTLVAWLAARMVTRPGLRNGLALMAAVLVLVWIHTSCYFFLVPLVVWIVWEAWWTAPPGWRAGSIARRVWPVPAGVAVGVPLLMLLLPRSGRVLGKSEFDSGRFHIGFVESFFGDVTLLPQQLDFSEKRMAWLLTLALAWWAWQACRTLRREGLLRGERWLMVLLTGMPLAVLVFQHSGNFFDMVGRYVAFFSVPCLLAAAVALGRGVATGAGGATRGQRMALVASVVGLVGLQFAASAFSRGDQHRSALRWVVENVKQDVAFFPVQRSFTVSGLRRVGWTREPDGNLKSRERNGDKAAQVIAADWKLPFNKGVIVRYNASMAAGKGLRKLVEDGAAAGFRQWEIYDAVQVLAFARTPAELAWLQGLPVPELEMGRAVEESLYREDAPAATPQPAPAGGGLAPASPDAMEEALTNGPAPAAAEATDDTGELAHEADEAQRD